MCKAWRNKKTGLQSFIAWAESLPPEKQWKPGLELDRIDNDGNYCPKNCRFTTPKKNSRNKRNNIWVTFKGKEMLLVKAWEKYGNPKIPYGLVKDRYKRCGWSVKEAISKPTRVKSTKLKG